MTVTEPSTASGRTRRARPIGTVLTAVGVMLVAANLRPVVVSVAPLIDEIRADTGFSSTTAGLLTTLPVLFFGLSAPVAPRLAARFGIERTIFGALLLLIVGTLMRLVPGTALLFAGSAVVGAAIGMCNVVLPALIKRDFAHRSGLMTGLYSMTLSGGAAVAAGVTVPLDNTLGNNWRLTIAAWVILAVVTAVIWTPQITRRSEETVAATGTLRRNTIAWAITVFMGAQSLVFYTFTAWLPAYLTNDGYSAAAAGTILAVGQVVALLASLIVPIIAGRFADQRVITLIVVALCGIGLAGLLLTDHATVLWTILVMFGPGASISLALLFMVLRSSSAEQTGQVSGMAQSVGYILAAFGPIVVGALHDSTGSWNIAMSVLAIPILAQAASTLIAARDVKMDRKQPVANAGSAV
ncbi:CynX/NimT family MFS transporter [Gordonia sp. DT219]|uniref:CynX/NimT family MFS transporter n=1 Tax=Gordonia sp. DT219 TaxID=3416658 RepID=UPI003CF57058